MSECKKFDIKYRIFQPTLGSNRVLLPFKELDISGEGKVRFDFDFYRQTYVGEMTVKETELIKDILDAIYVKFNEDSDIYHYGYPDFRGHSMSVGDIVAIEDEFFYCDIDGWSRNIRVECGYPDD